MRDRGWWFQIKKNLAHVLVSWAGLMRGLPVKSGCRRGRGLGQGSRADWFSESADQAQLGPERIWETGAVKSRDWYENDHGRQRERVKNMVGLGGRHGSREKFRTKTAWWVQKREFPFPRNTAQWHCKNGQGSLRDFQKVWQENGG